MSEDESDAGKQKRQRDDDAPSDHDSLHKSVSPRLQLIIAEIDIYRTANIMIRQHGSRAHIHAAMRADKLLEEGDLDGSRTWLRIIHAIFDLNEIEAGDASIH